MSHAGALPQSHGTAARLAAQLPGVHAGSESGKPHSSIKVQSTDSPIFVFGGAWLARRWCHLCRRLLRDCRRAEGYGALQQSTPPDYVPRAAPARSRERGQHQCCGEHRCPHCRRQAAATGAAVRVVGVAVLIGAALHYFRPLLGSSQRRAVSLKQATGCRPGQLPPRWSGGALGTV